MPITPDIILVLAVLFLVVLFFIFEWVRVDMVGIMVMVCLPLLGLVTPQQAISGLSSNAVVSIIAVIIIGAGLDKTGVMNKLARLILRFAGRDERKITSLVAATVAGISGFMQNIGAAALLCLLLDVFLLRPEFRLRTFCCPWLFVPLSVAL